ncbi:PAS domain-containing protein [Microvirga tunisiensis]|nr:PAS domain-containing protein [Microvirga tunisiensis]
MYPLPTNEEDRLMALSSLRLLDTDADPHLDSICRLATSIFDVPMSAVSIMGPDTQYIKGRCGIDVTECSRDLAFCNHTIIGEDLVVVPDARLDNRFRHHPAVSDGSIRFYAGAPLVLSPGLVLGSLCVADITPRQLTSRQEEQLAGLANLVVSHLRSHERKIRTQEELDELQQVDARYRVLTDLLPQKIWVQTPDGIATYYNRRVREHFGSLGPDFEERIKAIHPEDLGPLRATYEASYRSGTPYTIDARVLHVDGSYRWHRINALPIERDGQIVEWAHTGLDIHELRVAQEELRETSHLLQVALDAAAAGTWVSDHVEGITRISAKEKEILGLPADHPDTFPVEYWYEIIDSRDLPGNRQIFDAAVKERRDNYQFEYRVKAPDGSDRWIQTFGRIIYDAAGELAKVVGLGLDITDRKNTEEALRSSGERLAHAIEATDDGLWDWHIKTGYGWNSPRWCTILGYHPDEIELHVTTWINLIHPDDHDRVMEVLQVHLEGKTPVYECEHRLRHKDGHWVWILDRGKVVDRDEAGEALRMVGTISDISERKRNETALAEAKAAAEQANQAKSEFLATVSHEIRTPLAGILGYTDLFLEDRSLTQEQLQRAKKIHSAGSALLTVVNDILDFSRIEAGQIEFAYKPFSIATFVDDTLSIIKGLADKKGLQLSANVEGGIPSRLIGDEGRLRQVLLNLLNNAVKFTPAGGIKLLVEQVNQVGEACTLRFVVSDTGIGIADNQKDRLFKRFSQVDGLKRAAGGTGLGLAISKHLVQLMGGEIAFESIEGCGSTFWFSIGLDKADPIPDPFRKQGTREIGRATRILVVEDVTANQEIAQSYLEADGHAVDVVANGSDAIKAVQDNAYDLVLMDIQMPGMDGLTATQLIRKLDHPARDVPVIAMTAYVLPQQVKAFLDAGMNGHVGKPFNRAELNAAIERWTPLTNVNHGPSYSAALDQPIFQDLIDSIGPAKTLKMLQDLAPNLQAEFPESLNQDGRLDLARRLHSLTYSGMLGFMAFSKLCREVEHACLSGQDPSALLPVLNSLRIAVLSEIDSASIRLQDFTLAA